MSKEVCEHFCHAIVLAVFLCLGMKYLLNQSDEVACTRSAFIAGVAFIYMIMFGHNLPPKSLNPKLKFF